MVIVIEETKFARLNRTRTQSTAVLVCALLLAACSRPAEPPPVSAQSAPTVRPVPKARAITDAPPSIFPHYRVVAFYGAAGVPGLGVLGQGTPNDVAGKVETQARAYAAFGRPVLPALELIATVVQQERGASGTYSVHSSDAEIRTYLAAARRIHAMLILDVQPGYRSFNDEAHYYEKYLVQPDVGLALDSEWSMDRSEVPGKTIGHTTAAVVNGVALYLARLVSAHHLQQKLLVVHLFTPDMVSSADRIVAQPGVAITFHIDGFGGRAAKLSHYSLLKRRAPFYNGFKLFFKQDINMLPAAEVMRLHPAPDLITYE